ncbi:Vesicle transport protein SFT2B [Tritrichomonas foetus]|uniref:Vesicle transport protein n=1 Tax=Tritrichomonas foetus TaxID=1144522 RepID=A0A1J4JPR6_9EUKA|nr:Vesicle transport protein SFT2B [Tritrichomonas foetus]|eukprot:OHS99517.1 Vesicle transport protein SFT2B [Tritrichomonas foetus]
MRVSNKFWEVYNSKKSSVFLSMSQFTEVLNGDDKEDNCLNMSFKTRLIAGGICIGCGILLSFLSFISISSPTTFAIFYTLGTICAIGGSFFIAGPKTHIKALKFMPHAISTGVLVACIIMVFISALAIDSMILSILFVIGELIAVFFFTATLKETTWAIVKNFLKKVFSCCKKN